MKIVIDKITLDHFKGCEHAEVNFCGGNAVISGRNRSGKTTIYDAFVWALFGKDSHGRSDFEIKTIKDGETLHGLEHSVTLDLLVDNQSLQLKRVYFEDWVKPRGREEKVLAGHVTEFYVNGVKCRTKKEYESVVANMCDEAVFRLVTCPGYFFTLKPEDQKAVLYKLSGEISDSDVAHTDDRFAELRSVMEQKTANEYRRELSMKIKDLRDQIDILPEKIRTATSMTPEKQDWDALRRDLQATDRELSDVRTQIREYDNADGAYRASVQSIKDEIARKKDELYKAQEKVRSDAMKEVNAALSRKSLLSTKCCDLKMKYASIRSGLKGTASMESEIAELEKKNEDLRNTFFSIAREKFQAPEGLTCPTCGQPLPEDQAEEKIGKAREEHNTRIARRKMEIQTAGKANNDRIAKVKASIEAAKAQNEYIESEAHKIDKEIAKAEEEMNSIIIPETPSISYDTPEITSIQNEIKILEDQLSAPKDMSSAKQDLNAKVYGLEQKAKLLAGKLGLESHYNKCVQDIKDLNASLDATNKELASVERTDFLTKELLKAKDGILEDRINANFRMLRFRFTDEQINGGYKITCIPTVDGVPLESVNNADRINAGIDMINALCKVNDFYAPLFVDNAEAVNEVLHSDSQQILLVVTDSDVCFTNR